MGSVADPKKVSAPGLPPVVPVHYETDGVRWAGIIPDGQYPELIAPADGAMPGATRATLGFFRVLPEEAPEAVADLRGSVFPLFLLAVGMDAPAMNYDDAVRDAILRAWGAHTQALLSGAAPPLYMEWWGGVRAWAGRWGLLPPPPVPVFTGESQWPAAVRDYVVAAMYCWALGERDVLGMSIGEVQGRVDDVTLHIETPASLAIETREAILARVVALANAWLDEQDGRLRAAGFRKDPAAHTHTDAPYRWAVRYVVGRMTFAEIARSEQLSDKGVTESRVRKAARLVMSNIGIDITS